MCLLRLLSCRLIASRPASRSCRRRAGQASSCAWTASSSPRRQHRRLVSLGGSSMVLLIVFYAGDDVNRQHFGLLSAPNSNCTLFQPHISSSIRRKLPCRRRAEEEGGGGEGKGQGREGRCSRGWQEKEVSSVYFTASIVAQACTRMRRSICTS